MHFLLAALDGATDRLLKGLYEEQRMDKGKEIELKVEQIKDALLKLGIIGLCMPQLIEIRTNEDGTIDFPMRVRFEV